ncbi:hypothetical protein GCM10023203_57370 [Actinomycetospora straminea]|uniref:Uncharacterized protein n=1 Tax=Actinomycetospora straminea TaxID=663607 RepID=A0ABP9F8T1_9PSEU
MVLPCHWRRNGLSVAAPRAVVIDTMNRDSTSVFNLEDGDKFFTAEFTVNPFETQ